MIGNILGISLTLFIQCILLQKNNLQFSPFINILAKNGNLVAQGGSVVKVTEYIATLEGKNTWQ